jgi:tetratricopeptide (TPR) repeat protein
VRTETFYNLGIAYGELGQLKAAIKAYNRAFASTRNIGRRTAILVSIT